MVAAVTVRKNGKAEMAYVGETPWHGLGNVLKPGASLNTWIKEAGMDWSVDRHAVQFTVNNKLQTWDDNHVLYRSDSRKPLAVVSDGYQIVQPGTHLRKHRPNLFTRIMLLESHGFSLPSNFFLTALSNAASASCG